MPNDLNLSVYRCRSASGANLPNQYSALCSACLWRMHRHGPVIAHCADSEEFLRLAIGRLLSSETVSILLLLD